MPIHHSPAQQPGSATDTSAVQREALAAQWLSVQQISTWLSPLGSNGSYRVSELRRAGLLLAVYVTQPMPGYRYPTWQFGPDRQPVDHLAEIIKVLRDFGPFERERDGLRRSTGWGEVEWFLSRHALLNGVSPAETLATDPMGVLQAARTEFRKKT